MPDDLKKHKPRPRKVWITIASYYYEGYNLPVGVFTTKKKAEAAKKGVRGDEVDVLEFTLDKKENL
jgi:hypothetical protein